MRKRRHLIVLSCLLALGCGETSGPKTSSSSNWLTCKTDRECAAVAGTCDEVEKVCVDPAGNKIVVDPEHPGAPSASSTPPGPGVVDAGAHSDASAVPLDAGCSTRGCGASQGDAGLSCQLPLEVGPCKALFEVFGFDTATGECVPFVYGGCQGNANRFDTLVECEQACKP